MHELEVQAKALDQLRSELTSLSDRLEPVMGSEREMGEKSPGGDVDVRDVSPIVQSIQGNTTLIRRLTSQAQGLAIRVQI